MILMLSDPANNERILGEHELGPKISQIWLNVMPTHPIYDVLFHGYTEGNGIQCRPPRRRPVRESVFDRCRGCVVDIDELERDTQPLRQELDRIPSRILIAFVSDHDQVIGERGIALNGLSILKKDNQFYRVICIDNMTDAIIDFLVFIAIFSCSNRSQIYKENALKMLERLLDKYGGG